MTASTGLDDGHHADVTSGAIRSAASGRIASRSPPVRGIGPLLARMIDRRIARRDLPPEALTRYRIVRRSVTATIM